MQLFLSVSQILKTSHTVIKRNKHCKQVRMWFLLIEWEVLFLLLQIFVFESQHFPCNKVSFK